MARTGQAGTASAPRLSADRWRRCLCPFRNSTWQCSSSNESCPGVTAAVARAVMTVAAASLGENRREWALAMQAELDAAIEDGRPLAFAMGCLIAAWREMPRQAQGRFTLANYALALGVLIPTAVLQLACVAGFPYLFLGRGGIDGMVAAGASQDPYLADSHLAAVPVLVALWLLLGIGHLRLAWLLLGQYWSRVAKVGALMAAVSATLVIFAKVLFIDDAGVALQALLLALQLSAIYASARWHARLFPSGHSGRPAW